ncbi:MAG TPA: SLC13 family permease, partial [archaeon]|nr:SLC13 family permease [archaeon]
PEIKKLNLKANNQKLNSRQKLVLIVFFATVLLWIFGDFFSLQSSVVALIPVILFYILRLVDNNDFSKLNWPILSLIGSGIVLGYAMHESQFDLFIASLLQDFIAGQPLFLVVLAISIISVLVTMFVSNTASSALMIPLLIPLAPIVGLKPEVIIIIAAIGASLDFTAPMGTPPNAIAYSTGFFSVKEMAKAGLILSLLASILLALFATFVWI